MTNYHLDGSECDCQPPAYRFQWSDLVVVATTTVLNFARVGVSIVDQVDDIARAHANWRRDRNQFTASVQDSIERL